MIIKYVLDKSFGPPGSFTGYFILLVGLITVCASWSGLGLSGLGSFVACSRSGCMLDCDNFKIRFTDNLCRLFKVEMAIYPSKNTDRSKSCQDDV